MEAESAPQTNLVDGVREELLRIDRLEINEHGRGFESLHQKLQKELSSIDGL